MRCAPFGVAISPDKSRIYVTCEGSESVTVIDVQRAARFSFAPTVGDFAQDLSASANYVTARIAVGHDPRGITLTPDGRRLAGGQPARRYAQRDRHADQSCLAHDSP